MEEQKIVSMENSEQPKKLTYEELNDTCVDMSEQIQKQNIYIQKLHKQMQEMSFALQSRRMDYLLEIIKMQDKFSSDFVVKCVSEVEETMTIPEEQKEQVKNN